MRKLKFGILFIIISVTIVLLIIKIDLTAHVYASANGNEILYWRGNKYISTGGEYHEGATIARTRDGWDINAVVGESPRNYVVIRSFLDQYLLVREDFEASDDYK